MAAERLSLLDRLAQLQSIPPEQRDASPASLEITNDQRQRLKQLLELQNQAEAFLEKPPSIVEVVLSDTKAAAGPTSPGLSQGRAGLHDETPTAGLPALPTNIGPYTILEFLGEGGMGTVYKAEQLTPVKRVVALKLIKLGLDSRDIITRFESERQALARMDHPNIARVFDAGTDERGRPYFAMEYVQGAPITAFSDANKLSIRQRLELFQQTCAAISHAHTKAIIHRDIKAGNVLAYMADGKPAVKVIDFGIAKGLTGDRLTDRTLQTGDGMAIGTYETMSPEQADGSPDIDTRTDVYSLGVLLYELLSGVKPFDTRTLKRVAEQEIRRMIREDEPPRPSTRLSTLKESRQVAEARQLQLHSLTRQLRGELEWIPLKALRKEKSRRYASPGQMSEDIQNYITGRPLIAGPESQVYQLRKFIRRHVAGITAAAAFVVLLITGVVTTTIEAVHALRAEHRATQATTRAVAAAEDARDRLAQRLVSQGDLYAHDNQLPDAALAYETARQSAAPNSIASKLVAFAAADFNRRVTRPILTVANHASRTQGVIVSRDSRAVVSGFADGSIQANDILTGNDVWPPKKLTDDPAGSRVLAIAPDGRVVVAVGSGPVLLLDPTSGKISNWLSGHKAQVNGGVFSPDGSTFVTVSADGTSRRWSWPAGTPVGSAPIVTARRSLTVALFGNSGELIIGGDDDTVRFLDPMTGKPFRAPIDCGDQCGVRSLALSGENVLAIGTDYGQLLLCPLKQDPAPIVKVIDAWDAWQGVPHQGAVTALAFSADGQALFSAGCDRAIRCWSISNSAPQGPQYHLSRAYIGQNEPVTELLLIGDGRQLISSGLDGRVLRWVVDSCDAVQQLPGNASSANSVSFALNDRVAAVGGDDGRVRLWDVSTGLRLPDAGAEPKQINSLAASVADPPHLYSGGADAALHCWDLATGKEDPAREFRFNACICGLAYSRSGKYMAVGLMDGFVNVLQWQGNAWHPIWPANKRLHTGNVSGVAFTNDESEIITGDWNGDGHALAKVTRLSDGVTRLTIPATENNTMVVQACPDGRNFLVAGARHSPWLRSLETGAATVTATGHSEPVWAAAVSPDGNFIFTGGEDGLISLWNAHTGEKLRQFSDFSYWLRSIALSGDAGDVKMISATYARPEQLYLWDFGATASLAEPPSQVGDPRAGSASPEYLRALGKWYFARHQWADSDECVNRAAAAGAAPMPLLRAKCAWGLGDVKHARSELDAASAGNEAPPEYLSLLKRALIAR